MSFNSNYLLFIFISLFLFFKCLDSYNNIYIPFNSKILRVDYENEEIYESPEDHFKILNSSSFLNRWFYNGIYSKIQIGNPSNIMRIFYTFDNSYFSIENCQNIKQSFSKSITKKQFNSSKTLTINYIKNEKNNVLNKIGNDYAIFYNSPFYNLFIYINENYNGIDFTYDDKNNNNDDQLCGNIGLKINKNNENTNFIEQLKKKGIISKYIFTINYITLSQGVISFGSEPHFYNKNQFYYSQYKTIYTNVNKNNWAFSFNKININGTNIQLKDKNCELYIDHGLIIGTEEYKKIIQEIYFNKLINEEICFKEIVKLNNSNELSNEYIIFYCDKLKFKGSYGDSSMNTKPYTKFNDILLYQKGFEYIFKMRKEILFEEIEDKLYFLIIFYSNYNNNIWKLGEPFLSEYKFVFNIEQKTIGFYNTLLEKIPNSKYDFDNIEKNEYNKNTNINNKDNTILTFFKNMKNIMLILVSIFIIIFIIKKLLMKRKLRANELLDNFEYLSNQNQKTLNNSFDTK